MRIGASTFIWVSPFSLRTLDLIDKVKAFGFDLIEICVEDPDTIDTAVIGHALKRAGLGVTVCGAFGPNRDMSSDDPAVRDNAIGYSRRCVDIAAELGSEVVVGPMYAAVGNTRLLAPSERRRQWAWRGNSGSSSRNSTPRCARPTSPGRARWPYSPPPASCTRPPGCVGVL
jgi:D-psicose/D-tagatose/L-ribulose 3-epimerase